MFDLKFVSDIKTQDDKMKMIADAVKKISNMEVLVGIPAEESGRDGSVNNAELLYIHTHGSAVKNIPARPVIEPAIEDDRETIGDLLKKAAKAATDGDSDGAIAELEKAGMRGQNVARDWFDNPKNDWDANKNKTIAAKGSDKPLIDTATLRGSIVYIVREK